MKGLFAIALAMLFSFAGSVEAQSGRAQWSHGQRVETRAQHFDFRDENVQGAVLRPTDATSFGNRHMRGSSLLRIRQHFVQEMNEAVENL